MEDLLYDSTYYPEVRRADQLATASSKVPTCKYVVLPAADSFLLSSLSTCYNSQARDMRIPFSP